MAIHIFFLKSAFISFPKINSLPCFPLKWRAYEFFPGGDEEDTSEGPE